MDTPKVATLKFVCIADTHEQHRQLTMPEGDVLLVAGDFTGRGRRFEIEDFDAWLAVQPYKVKIVVAGNHDQMFESHPREAQKLLPHATYLQDSEITLRSALFDHAVKWRLNVYGSPWQPRFYHWAFNLDRGSEALHDKWRQIPTGVDVLVTHSAPKEIMDYDLRGDRGGCELLRDELRRIKPRLHVFGHLHGTHDVVEKDGTIFVNASICDEHYEVHREPIVIELEVGVEETQNSR